MSGYWRCDDALGATSLKDLSGNGNDISVQSGVQLDRYPPLPYLERVSDWTQNNGTGMDTNIDLDADGDFTVFGFFWIDDFLQEQVLFGIEPTSGTSLQLGLIRTNEFMRHEKSTGSGFGVRSVLPKTWTHFVFTWDGANTEMRTFFSGVRHDINTNSSFKDISGKFIFGGATSGGSKPFRGRLSRVGLMAQKLTDKEATLLYLRSSTVLTQEYYRF